MFNVLDRYIGRAIFGTIMTTLFMLVSLSGIIKFVEQLKKTGDSDYNAVGALLYTLMSIPKDIEVFFPMAALLGALMGLGALATRSELVAMEAAGYTRLKIAMSVMKTAIPLVILAMAIGEWVAPASEQAARNMRAQMIYGNSLLSTKTGLWAKDGNNFIYIERVTGDNELSRVSIYQFDDNRKLTSITAANSATFHPEQHHWVLSQVTTTDLKAPQKIVGRNKINLEWQTTLTPDKLGIVVMNPESLSASGLKQYIDYLKISGQESSLYQMLFWNKLLTPISVAVMMLMALSFVFGPLRSVPMGVRIVTGISFGFIFYVLNKIFGQLSVVYSLHPLLSALLPSLLFLVLSIYLLRKKQ